MDKSFHKNYKKWVYFPDLLLTHFKNKILEETVLSREREVEAIYLSGGVPVVSHLFRRSSSVCA